MLSEAEESLRRALFKWRKEKAEQLYADIDYYGPDIFIHYRIIDEIVALAHEDKLPDVQALKDQTHWDLADEYGSQIIDLIRLHCPSASAPSSPFATTPLAPASVSVPDSVNINDTSSNTQSEQV